MTDHDPEALPPCPECHEAYSYEQGHLLVCPMCGHEWSPAEAAGRAAGEDGAGRAPRVAQILRPRRSAAASSSEVSERSTIGDSMLLPRRSLMYRAQEWHTSRS